jgi:hypothetical protein
MIARIARWDPFPDAPWVTEVGCSVPGILGLYHVVGADGAGLSISFAEDEAAIAAATQAIVAENARRGPDAFSGSPTEVATCRVHAYTTSA